jgi:hypothetical protein
MSRSELYVPKRTKWGSLTDFKSWLQKETKESVVSFNGHELITVTTKYTLQFGELIWEPAPRAKPVRKTAAKSKSAEKIKSRKRATSK